MFRLACLFAASTLLALSNPGRAQAQPAEKGTTFSATVTDAAQNAPAQREWRVSGRITAPQPPEKRFDWALVVSIVVPIVIALVGIGGAYRNSVRTEEKKYWNSVRTEEWKAKIAFINDQLEHLYGPLFSLSNATDAAWREFRRRTKPDGPFHSDADPPNKDQLREWVAWIRLVFAPMNDAMVKAIVNHAHLIEGRSMPQSFLDLIAHVEGYRVTIDKWERKDFSQYLSVVNFPDSLKTDVAKTFEALKRRQMALLGHSVAEGSKRAREPGAGSKGAAQRG